MTFFPRAARVLTGSALLAALALLASPDPANAGFFDFLFQPQPPPGTYMPLPRAMYEHHRFRQHHASGGGRRRAPKQVVLRRPKWDEKETCCRGREASRPAPVLLDDDTLREGDAVMTHYGIKVFTGDAGPHHQIDDFILASQAGHISKRARKALLAMDPFRSGSDAEPRLTTGRSVAEPAVSAGDLIVDPKGKSIRYVGP